MEFVDSSVQMAHNVIYGGWRNTFTELLLSTTLCHLHISANYCDQLSAGALPQAWLHGLLTSCPGASAFPPVPAGNYLVPTHVQLGVEESWYLQLFWINSGWKPLNGSLPFSSPEMKYSGDIEYKEFLSPLFQEWQVKGMSANLFILSFSIID